MSPRKQSRRAGRVRSCWGRCGADTRMARLPASRSGTANAARTADVPSHCRGRSPSRSPVHHFLRQDTGMHPTPANRCAPASCCRTPGDTGSHQCHRQTQRRKRRSPNTQAGPGKGGMHAGTLGRWDERPSLRRRWGRQHPANTAILPRIHTRLFNTAHLDKLSPVVIPAGHGTPGFWRQVSEAVRARAQVSPS